MKVQKGEAGYLQARRNRLIIEVLIYVILVVGILLFGIIQTKTKLNYFTIAAVFLCLPGCRALVNLIMVLPNKSIKPELKQEIDEKTEYLDVVYDLVVTSEKSAMPIQAIVISSNTVCGYTSSFKVSKSYAAEHIKSILEQNGIERVTVKVFRDYVSFLSRAEGLNSMAAIQRPDEERIQAIRSLILDISL